MGLSTDLISQFAKLATEDTKKETKSTMYGYIVESNGSKYVKLDGSGLLTPIESNGSELLTPIEHTADVKDGDRVLVTIENHTATVTGNLSSPAARTDDVSDLSAHVDQVDILVANKIDADIVKANYATIGNLAATNVEVETLKGDYAEFEKAVVKTADIDNLIANNATVKNLGSTKLSAESAVIQNLQADSAAFRKLEGDYAEFEKAVVKTADIDNLIANSATVKNLGATYASLDFANIDEAAVEKFYAVSGIIKDLTLESGVVVKELVGVYIKGDLIEAGTLKADKLVVKGEDGLFYKLNYENGTFKQGEAIPEDSLHGSVITAKSIAAEKISVSDLVAFGATIGGFKIETDSLHSVSKPTMDSDTPGVYLHKDGQIAIGDNHDYLKYQKDADGNYNLDIAAKSLHFSTTGENVQDVIENNVSEIYDSVSKQNEGVTAACAEMILEAAKDYANTGDYTAFKESVTTALDQQSKQISDNFEAANEAVNGVYNDLQNTKGTLSKHFDFDDDGITIKIGEHAMKLRLDNDLIGFYKGTIDETDLTKNRFGWWDGIDFHTGNIIVELNERAQFGNFAFVPRSDGSLMFLKVGDS